MSEQGFVLVPALLFLFLVSILVFDTYEALSVQYQLQQTAQLQQQLFFLAEHGLHLGETTLQTFSESGLSVKVVRLPIYDKTSKRQIVDYQVSSIAKKLNQSVCLRSIVEVGMTPQRKAWLVLKGDDQC
jgi:hypothetical protein